jgi:hypothetical protein
VYGKYGGKKLAYCAILILSLEKMLTQEHMGNVELETNSDDVTDKVIFFDNFCF